METTRKEIVEVLKKQLGNEYTDRIIDQACQEAIIQVRDIIREALLQRVLERLASPVGEAKAQMMDIEAPLTERADSIEQGKNGSAISELTSGEKKQQFQKEIAAIKEQLGGAEEQSKNASPTSEPTPAEKKEQLLKEIAAIKEQIAANEEHLSASTDITPANEPSAAESAPATEERGENDDRQGLYVYGILDGRGEQPAPEFPEKGIDPPHPIYVLSHETLCAVVSKVSFEEFDEEALEANLNDVDWLKSKIHIHHQVLNTIAAESTVIPMRFCTIYKDETRVKEMLIHYHKEFIDALTRVRGRKEWGVKVFCDDEVLVERVAEVSEEIKALESEVAGKSRGKAYFEKKRVEEAKAEEAERLGDTWAQESHDRLSALARESAVNTLQSKQVTERKDRMVLNGAYLLDDAQLPDFRSKVQDLVAEYEDYGVTYELTGPWPPYSFVQIGAEKESAHV